MTVLFDYPKSAAFGRPIPKSKIYAMGDVSAATKNLFVKEIDQIIWQYKLAPETINLAAKGFVGEIEIMTIALKTGQCKHDVLRCIDKAIPRPLIFELNYESTVKTVAAYKRPSETDESKWVVSDYFETGWLPADSVRRPLPMVFDLEALYVQLLDPLMPFPGRPDELIQERVTRIGQILQKEREIQKCQARLNKEKQFNRKVEINSELRRLKQDMELLTAVHDTP